MVQQERIKTLNDDAPAEGAYVLYWMQQSQRAEYNHALEHAIACANKLGQPVVVGFGLMDDYPEANLRHYTFMLEGLKDAQVGLGKRGIQMVVRRGSPDDVAIELGKRASLIVCDRGYLRHQEAWRARVAKAVVCKVEQVETDVIVPVEIVSNKAEYAARTIRPKISKHLEKFLVEIKPVKPKQQSVGMKFDGLELSDVRAVADALELDGGVAPVSQFFQGGAQTAESVFRRFIKTGLKNYSANRNQPHTDDVSYMSPYLHFGQISPLYLALEIRKQGIDDNTRSFLEELTVRRELGMNFVNFTPAYDRFVSLPDWARKTLAEHKQDKREPRYTRRALEAAQTHDRYWNAAMQEAKRTGYMHNYMRMYWGKKILEWSASPETGFKNTLAIMNKYFLDGRDCLSYSNTAWIYGLHDRAWQEREVFGKIRYQSAAGLERKCDMRAYLDKVDGLGRDFSDGVEASS